MQFELRKDMRMAPIHRVSCDQLEMKRANLTALLKQWRSGENADSASVLGLRKFGRTDYLHELKTKQHMPLSSPSTWPVYVVFCTVVFEGQFRLLIFFYWFRNFLNVHTKLYIDPIWLNCTDSSINSLFGFVEVSIFLN
ncbi:Chromatin assembly factor 1 subunit A-A [Fasciola gigantica]|uniref:Chromatin assembly factor 1 subunit A-A n=1 Tax=Fasciola gigantica TaxID=46835 RepID=A0A504YFK6_FASGI|nr:Chromatin assembly factor 1 subunit A-A [Fasciola gigantica]